MKPQKYNFNASRTHFPNGLTGYGHSEKQFRELPGLIMSRCGVLRRISAQQAFQSTLKAIVGLLLILFPVSAVTAATFYVAPDGDDAVNPGTFSEPFATLQRATYAVSAGDTILIREGVYDIETYLDISGTGTDPISIASYSGETAIFDGSGHPPSESVKFRITGSWLIIRRLEIRNGPSDGVLLTDNASNNRLEFIESHGNYLAGFELEGGAAENLIINCDSHHNFDSGNSHGEHADGFGAKYDVGSGNQFIGCRAWSNSDDGFDLWATEHSVLIENCRAYDNGFDIWGVGSQFAGDGNGFKLGPSSPVIRFCVAWHNATRGFDFNDATDLEYVYNNTSYNHPLHGFNFSDAAHVLRNNLSFNDAANQITPEVDDVYNSWNTPPGVTVTAADFVSLDDTDAKGARAADGTLPDSQFLHLTADSDLIDAGIDVGLPFSGTAPDLGAFEYSSEVPSTDQSGIILLLIAFSFFVGFRGKSF